MSDDRKNQRGQVPGSDEGRAIAVLRRLPRAQASAEARSRARAAFLAPALGEGARTRRRSLAFVLPAAALLAAALALFMIGTAPTAQWVVLDVVGPAGVTTPAGGTVVIGTRLKSGTVATADGSELELQLGDRLRFRMMPGTSVSLPSAPGRWFNRDRELQLTSGELYGTTAGQKLGFPLRLVTDELSATLTGTTFAVFRTPEASCVCLWEGGITVVPSAGADASVVLLPHQRVWVFRDARAPEVLPLSDMETMKLQMTQDAGLAFPLPPKP